MQKKSKKIMLDQSVDRVAWTVTLVMLQSGYSFDKSPSPELCGRPI